MCWLMSNVFILNFLIPVASLEKNRRRYPKILIFYPISLPLALRLPPTITFKIGSLNHFGRSLAAADLVVGGGVLIIN